MNPDFDILEREHVEENKNVLAKAGVYDPLKKSIRALVKINEKICSDKTIGRDKQIGHSFLFKVRELEDLLLVWRHEVLPLLEEYCYGDYGKINRLLFNKDSSTEWVDQSKGIGNLHDSRSLDRLLDEIIKNAQPQ